MQASSRVAKDAVIPESERDDADTSAPVLLTELDERLSAPSDLDEVMANLSRLLCGLARLPRWLKPGTSPGGIAETTLSVRSRSDVCCSGIRCLRGSDPKGHAGNSRARRGSSLEDRGGMENALECLVPAQGDTDPRGTFWTSWSIPGAIRDLHDVETLQKSRRASRPIPPRASECSRTAGDVSARIVALGAFGPKGGGAPTAHDPLADLPLVNPKGADVPVYYSRTASLPMPTQLPRLNTQSPASVHSSTSLRNPSNGCAHSAQLAINLSRPWISGGWPGRRVRPGHHDILGDQLACGVKVSACGDLGVLLYDFDVLLRHLVLRKARAGLGALLEGEARHQPPALLFEPARAADEAIKTLVVVRPIGRCGERIFRRGAPVEIEPLRDERFIARRGAIKASERLAEEYRLADRFKGAGSCLDLEWTLLRPETLKESETVGQQEQTGRSSEGDSGSDRRVPLEEQEYEQQWIGSSAPARAMAGRQTALSTSTELYSLLAR
jgi:hypothetical protein